MITVLKDYGDGTYLGADENGIIYDGLCTEVGDDELAVETTIASDGSSYERVTSYGGTIIAKGTITRQSFFDSLGDRPSDEKEARWEAECAIDQHSKTFVQAMIDGELASIEKKRKIMSWEARS